MGYCTRNLIAAEDLEVQELVCTVCCKEVGLEKGAIFRHPALGVLLCKKCKKFYHLGEWTRCDGISYF